MHGLPAEYYTSPALFERERARIFGRHWLFAGLKMMVAKSGAYYARRLAGRPIVLQNLGGEVACFLNSCAHRNAEVQPEGFGVRGFVCGYHGFRYDIAGRVVSIPLEEERYQFTSEERACLKLKRYALEQVGQFLFVNFADDPMPIGEQFDDALLSQLRSLSDYLDTDLIHTRYPLRYNWKLPGENLRDVMHARFLHAKSLVPFFDFEWQPNPAQHAHGTLRELSQGRPEGRAKVELRWPYWEQLSPWPEGDDGYWNWLIFPNLHIATPDGGRLFGIEQYDPLEPGVTDFVHFMLSAKRTAPIPHGDAVLRGVMRDASFILAEDARMMESVQRGMTPESPPMKRAAYEGELHRFTTYIKAQVDG